MFRTITFAAAALMLAGCATAEPPMAAAPPPEAATYDAELAARLGADDYGMRPYVLAILMTGPEDAAITDPETRAGLFRGHFVNMQRLNDEGHLVLAGPLGGEDDSRGLFLFDTPDIDTARAWAETDPAVEAGIFTLEFSTYYGSAALLLVGDLHKTVQAKGIMD
ncbi:MAG: YciI family protein [Hyphomonas sp.]